MDERTKGCLSLVFFASAVLLPMAGFIAGWIAIDVQNGALIALITFGVCLGFAGIFLALIKEPGWLVVMLPYTVGFLYTVLPDFIPLVGIDDAIVFVLSALLSFFLWLKRQPNLPKWTLLPLVLSGLYALIGGFIPGPIDEFVVTAVMAGISIIGARNLPAPDESAAEVTKDEPN